MLPSRGLRPAHLAQTASRQSICLYSRASRKFSSHPRTAGLSASSYRNSPLQSAGWRTGATRTPNVVLTASSVRNGSWYAPWSWGKLSAPAGDAVTSIEQVPVAEFTSPAASAAVRHTEPVVTSATPEIAPAGIDKPSVVNETTSPANEFHDLYATSTRTIDNVLSQDPTKDFDPTALVNHAGQLKELGLDYGWGMSTMIEKMIEQIYLQSGWGWAGSIMVAAVGVRAVTFFFQALSSDRMAAIAALRPLTEPIQANLEDAIARGDKQKEQIYKLQQAQIMAPHMGGMFSMGGFMVVQGWIGFGAFRLLRAMADLPVPGMQQDGFLWFADLTVRDPYFILPAATTAIFYAIFKTGGEVGITNDIGGQAQMRQKLMIIMTFALGIVTAFQASALQLYFLASGILGAGTGWLLRQNSFRRAIRIRPIPSRESNELYSKVVKGELTLQQIKGQDGKVRYQAPTPQAPVASRRTTISGINVKDDTSIPLHLRAQAKLQDGRSPGQEPPKSALSQFSPKAIAKSTKSWVNKTIRNAGYGDKVMTEQQAKRKQRAEQYEIERRRRFENRS